MAYLMIVMQTTLHNPNIKMKLQELVKTRCLSVYVQLIDFFTIEGLFFLAILAFKKLKLVKLVLHAFDGLK